MQKSFKNSKKLRIGIDFDNTIVDYKIPINILLKKNKIKKKLAINSRLKN
tara:strand:- start:168 stop:317 length:150 start_codon:yes stop_codon:yes gene_type:complete